MLNKNNNLVATAIKETFDKTKYNYFLGDWCRKVIDDSDEQNSIKFIHKHHWSNKTKMDKDMVYLETFINRLITELGNQLNDLHEIKEQSLFWEIVLRPWLFSIVPQIYDRWEICRSFFNELNKMKFEFSFIEREEDSNLFSRESYRRAQSEDHWNQNIFSKIINENYRDRIIKKKIIKSVKLHKKKSNLNIRDILYFPIRFIDTKLINQNAIIFDTKQTSFLNFLRLSTKLKIFPITSYNFFRCLEKKIYKSSETKNLKKKLIRSFENKFNDKFEKFCISILIDEFPEVFLGSFNFARKLIKKIVNEKKKIIVSNADIFLSDVYRIWVATMCSKNSKLVINTHGGFIPEKYVNFNIQQFATKHITWHSPNLNENETQLTPLKLLGLKRKKTSQKYLSIIDIELSRYQFRMNSIPTPSEIPLEKKMLYDFVENLKTKIKNKVKYRVMQNYGWDFKKKFENKFGKNRIDNSKNLNELISCSKILIHKYPSTPFTESIYLNVPSILLYRQDSWRFRPEYDQLIKKLKLSKILFYDPLELSRHLNKHWDDIDGWWKSEKVQETLEYLKNNIMKTDKNWVNQYQKFFSDLKNDN
jgi:putative transferase (TIGR04331 family)